MADRYIDHDETKIYGEHAAKMIRKMAVGLVPAFDEAMEHLASEISHATEAVQAAVASGRSADAEVRKGTREKVPALDEARSLLSRFSSHLDAHEKGSVDRRDFFTGDGTLAGIGRSAPRVLLSLGHVSSVLRRENSPVRDAAAWQRDFARASRRLAPVIEHSHDARTDRSVATPEVEGARTAWLQTYIAARSGVESVLRLTGKLGLLPVIFHDLAVPASAKVTEAPADPVAPTP
jgi:hypothetical protein